MGCIVSSQRVDTTPMSTQKKWQKELDKETVLAALTRLDLDIFNSEKLYPAQRLIVVSAELESIQQEIKEFEETTPSVANMSSSYPKTMHQEMRKIELMWLRAREKQLQRERRMLHARLLRIRSLYTKLQQLLDSIWNNEPRPGKNLEEALSRAHALRDALATVSSRLRAAADYAHTALKLLDDALPTWKLASIGKCQRATETLLLFKEALIQLVQSIHQVLLNNVENLTVAEKDLLERQRQLRATRVNDIVKRGLADLRYESAALDKLKNKGKF
uniref:HM00051 protein n=1 Tax=Heliconius melpomene TaxID=34740 RepID=D0AB99_HELME|nr:HM00051 [Heliconius melpomene]